MALPTPTQLATMDWFYKGEPFVQVPAKATTVLTTMDFFYKAEPFVRNYETGRQQGPLPMHFIV